MYKRFLYALCVFALFASLVPLSFAANQSSAFCSVISSSESKIVPHADVIVYKYRIYNGVHQYRRWNETRGYWIDPYWIDIPQ